MISQTSAERREETEAILAENDEPMVQPMSPNLSRPTKHQMNNNASLFMTDSRMEETKYAGPQSQDLRKLSNKTPLPVADGLTDDFTERQMMEHDLNPSLDQKVSSNGGFTLAGQGKKA